MTTVFVNGVTLTDAGWFNDVDNAIYDEIVNVKNSAYGAVGDGATDDFTAIRAAVNAAAALTLGAHNNRVAVYFPPGIYKVASSACLTPTNTTSIAAGIHFFGAGNWTSILRLSTSGADLYFYNNVATPRLLGCTFADLGFEGRSPTGFSAYTDISDNAKGFRMWATTATGSNEQLFKFTRCRFQYLHTAFETAGDNTASENSFVQCDIANIKSVAFKIDNLQSFNHEFISTNFTVIYGDVFQIGANGGGAIKMYGGSVTMDSSTGANTWFLKAAASSGAGALPFIFSGQRFELRGDKTNLYSISTVLQFDIAFENTLFEDQGTATKASWATAGSQCTVSFRQCYFYETVATPISFVNSATVSTGENGTVTFDSCGLPIDWSDRCTTSSFYGAFRAINCHGTNIGAPAAGAHWAHDFDLHWNQGTAGLYTAWDIGATLRSDGSPTNTSFCLKVAQMKLPTEFWPSNTEQTLKMPKNALIKAIHLRKPAGTADGTVTTFRISDNTKTTHHLTSNSAAFNLTHTADVNDYYYHVGAAVADRTLRLNSSAVTTGNLQGGIVLVEYY